MKKILLFLTAALFSCSVAFGCNDTCIATTVEDIDNSYFNLNIAPNPVLAGSTFIVSTDLATDRRQGAICTIYDINGRSVICRSMTAASITFNAELTAGMYTVEIRTSDGCRLIQRLVVVR